jgi:hypothetical protein
VRGNIHGKAVMIYNFFEIDDIQRAALMIYRNELRMIYNALGALMRKSLLGGEGFLYFRVRLR